MSGFAWVTLATNDSYSLGALVLAHSLKQAGTAHQLAVLVTPGVTNVMRKNLADVFNVVEEVNLFDSKDEANLRLLKRPELGVTFTKLHCWRLTQFEKCVFLDADVLVLVNSDELFERDEFSAAPDVGWPDCFNSGVFVYKPSMETYNKLVDFALQKGSFDGGDQGLLNAFFSDWAHKDISKHLPFIYNMCSTASYSYLPAFKYYGANVKIVHFIGPAKPWLQYFDTESRIVHPSPDLQHLQEVLQRWWDIFCSLIHPKLTPDMSGLAGAFAQFTLGVKRSAAQDALENHLRRQAWEVGNIDYMGRDSFDNIWSKICQTLSTTQLESVKDGAVFSSENQQVPEVPPEGSTAAQTEVPQSSTPVYTESPVPPPTDVKIQEELAPPTNTEEQTPKPDVVPDPEPRKEEIPPPAIQENIPPVEAIIEPLVLTETVVKEEVAAVIADIPQTVIAESQEAQTKQEVPPPEPEPIKEVIPSEPEPESMKEVVPPQPEPETQPEPVKEVIPPQSEPETVKEILPPQSEPVKEVLPPQSEPEAVKEVVPLEPEPVTEVLPPQSEPEPVKEVLPPQSEPEPVKEVVAPEPEPVKEVLPPQSEPEPVKEVLPPQSEPEPVKEVVPPEPEPLKEVLPPQSEPEPVKEVPPPQSEPEHVKKVLPPEPKPEPIKEIPQPKTKPPPETQVKEVAPVEEAKPKPTKREAKAPKSPDSSKIAKTPKVETTLESPKAEAGPESPAVPESPKPEDVVEAEASSEVPKSDTKPKEVRKVKKKVKKVPKAEGDASEGASKK